MDAGNVAYFFHSVLKCPKIILHKYKAIFKTECLNYKLFLFSGTGQSYAFRLYESSREALEHKTRYFIIYRKQCLTVLIGSLCAVAFVLSTSLRC